MQSDHNKEVVNRFIEEVINKGNLDAINEIMAPDMIEHEEMSSDMPQGREGTRQYMAMFREAFPDLHVTIEDEVAEGDRVFMRSTWHGTHQGRLMGVDATGRHVEFSSMDEIRIADGKLKEHWGVTDTASLMQQLGVAAIPAI